MDPCKHPEISTEYRSYVFCSFVSTVQMMHVVAEHVAIATSRWLIWHVQKLSTSSGYTKPTAHSIRVTNITKIFPAILIVFSSD